MNKFSIRIVLLLLISSLILGLVMYQVTANVKNLMQQNAQIERSNQLLAKLSGVVSKLHYAQSLARGYLLTQDAQLQSQFKSLIYLFQGNLIELESAAGKEPTQRARVTQLVTGIRERLAGLEQTMAMSGASPAAIQNQIRADENNSLTALLKDMESWEQEALSAAQEQSNTDMMRTITVSIAGMSTCIAIFLFLFWLIDREGARRGKSEASLQAMVTQMETIQHEMKQMGSLADYLRSCRELTEIYSLIGQHLPNLFPGFAGSLGIYNNSRNVIEIVTAWEADGTPAPAEGEFFLAEDCWSLRRGAAHRVHAHGNQPTCRHLEPLEGGSLCVPMVAHGETMGVMCLTSPLDAITPQTAQLLQNVSEHISMAIANMRLELTLRTQSLRDPLTKLYNRRYMESSLEREIFRAKRRKEPISIIMIDIDHFKRFNDSYGHEAGDYVLCEFAQLLVKAVRGEDIACRYGGEEFILILPGAQLPIALKRAEGLRATMESLSLVHHGIALEAVTLSLGVLTYPDHCDDTSMLVRKADEALYRAKHGGRNRIEVARIDPIESAA